MTHPEVEPGNCYIPPSPIECVNMFEVMENVLFGAMLFRKRILTSVTLCREAYQSFYYVAQHNQAVYDLSNHMTSMGYSLEGGQENHPNGDATLFYGYFRTSPFTPEQMDYAFNLSRTLSRILE